MYNLLDNYKNITEGQFTDFEGENDIARWFVYE